MSCFVVPDYHVTTGRAPVPLLLNAAGRVGGRLRLVQLFRLAGAGLVRVTWSATWSEYQVRATGPGGRLVAEYFTDDRADALGTADAMLAELAAAAGVPA
jgi:hypothetical protein